MPAILITGASGFVGRALCAKMLAAGWQVYGTLLPSESTAALVLGVDPVVIEPLGPETHLRHVLIGIDIVVHLAARVHVIRETSSEPIYDFRRTNTLGTTNLAREAAEHGVKRLVFMSTIGVNGDNSFNKPYTEVDTPHPHNPYSVSKYEAELALKEISKKTGMDIVIIRAPIIYGPRNPGNFLSLLEVVNKEVPLPLASVNNSRSLIYVGNLVSALAICATHPFAAGQTYLVSDCEDVSTPELISRVAIALGVPARLFPFPVCLMHAVGRLTGKYAAVNRLTGSLTVDSSKIRQDLGWLPPFTMEEGLRDTALWFKQKCR